MDKLLEIKGLCFSYGEHKIFDNYNLSLDIGERIHISAPSGQGKTTLLRLIAGLELPDSGEIRTTGRIAYLFQEDRLLEWRTVLQNITIIGASRGEAQRVLEAVGLGGYANKYPRELSGGMRRRASIARLMCYGGDIVLLDEPFSGIDEATRERVIGAMNECFAKKAMILITHIQSEAEKLGARSLML
ncbi:MAG: ABC transporter ATP-binding protein [Clostridiales bacterium]|nr:ABC transporter ATP-binding protein [Clostridiales bacterium]